MSQSIINVFKKIAQILKMIGNIIIKVFSMIPFIVKAIPMVILGALMLIFGIAYILILVEIATRERSYRGLVEEAFMIIVPLIITAILGRVLFGYCKKHQCPNCKKLFHLKKLGKEEIGRKTISMLKETKIRDAYGDVTGYREQYIPGERIKYRVHKICQKCGQVSYSTYSKDYESV